MIEHVALRYTSNSSDKEYHVILESSGATYRVTAAWGRFRKVAQRQEKYSGQQHAARQAMKQLIQEKLNKGYQHFGGNVPHILLPTSNSASTPTNQANVPTNPQAVTSPELLIDEITDPVPFLTNDQWEIQEWFTNQGFVKLIGTHAVLEHGGQQFPVAIDQFFNVKSGNLVLECGVVADFIIITDFPSMAAATCQERLAFATQFTPLFQAKATCDEKEAWFDNLKSRKAAGVVFKYANERLIYKF